ncbi:hypothetical protein BG015_009024, partial [Linnemannia schmuckeri]
MPSKPLQGITSPSVIYNLDWQTPPISTAAFALLSDTGKAHASCCYLSTTDHNDADTLPCAAVTTHEQTERANSDYEGVYMKFNS